MECRKENLKKKGREGLKRKIVVKEAEGKLKAGYGKEEVSERRKKEMQSKGWG